MNKKLRQTPEVKELSADAILRRLAESAAEPKVREWARKLLEEGERASSEDRK